MFKPVLALAASLIVGISHAAPNVVDGQLQAPAGQGMVIIAVTATTTNKDTAEAFVELRSASGKRSSVYTRLDSDMIRAPGEQANTDGRLGVLTLPAGQYTVTQAGGTWSNGTRNSLTGRRQVSVPLNQSFELKSGDVLYLGQANVQLNNKPSVNFSLQTERDYFYLGEKYGVKNTANIQPRPLNTQ